MDYSFTARMEDNLDEVAEGERNWRGCDLYDEFRMGTMKAESEEGMRPNQPVPTDIGYWLWPRNADSNRLYRCVFGLQRLQLATKERCKTTIDLIPGEEAVAEDAGEEAETNALRANAAEMRHGDG